MPSAIWRWCSRRCQSDPHAEVAVSAEVRWQRRVRAEEQRSRHARRLTAERGLIEQLTRCRVTDIVGEYENTRGTIPQVQPGLTALLLNAAALLDIPAEIVRLGKEAQKAEKARLAARPPVEPRLRRAR